MDLQSIEASSTAAGTAAVQHVLPDSPRDPLANALVRIAKATTSTPRRTAPQLLEIDCNALYTELVEAAAASRFGKFSRWAVHDLAQIFTMLNLLTDDFGDQIRTNCRQNPEHCGELRRLIAMLNYVAGKLLETVRAGGLEAPRPTPLSEVVDTAIGHVRYQAKIRGVELLHHRSDDLASFSPFAIEQVLGNLLANAIEAIGATGRGDGVVEIAYAVQQGRLVINVSDNGPGVPPADYKRIFQCGYTTKCDGPHGFGLVICAHLVQAEGGTLSVSRSDSGGAKFTFDLAPTLHQPQCRTAM